MFVCYELLKKHIDENHGNNTRPPDLPPRNTRKDSVIQMRRRRRRTEVELLVSGIYSGGRETQSDEIPKVLRYEDELTDMKLVTDKDEGIRDEERKVLVILQKMFSSMNSGVFSVVWHIPVMKN